MQNSGPGKFLVRINKFNFPSPYSLRKIIMILRIGGKSFKKKIMRNLHVQIPGYDNPSPLIKKKLQ